MTVPEFFAPPGIGEAQLRQYHYSQAVRVGNRVETSGQGGWDDDGNIPETLEDEIVKACDNVARTLAAAGASWHDVIQVNSYHVPVALESFGDRHNIVMVEQFRARMPDRAPIWTALGVPCLGAPGMRVEIQVTAIVAREG